MALDVPFYLETELQYVLLILVYSYASSSNPISANLLGRYNIKYKGKLHHLTKLSFIFIMSCTIKRGKLNY